jgi:hypothetical protein
VTECDRLWGSYKAKSAFSAIALFQCQAAVNPAKCPKWSICPEFVVPIGTFACRTELVDHLQDKSIAELEAYDGVRYSSPELASRILCGNRR